MAVTIQKKSDKIAEVKAQTVATPGADELALKVDKLGANFLEMAEIKAHLKEYDKVHKPLFAELQTVLDEDVPADEEGTLTGSTHAIKFKAHGTMGSVTDVHMAFLMLENIKEGLGWEIMTFPVGEVRKYLTPDQFEQITDYESKKARQITVIELEGGS